VDTVGGGEAVGVFFERPAVVVDGGVQGLGAVADIVAEPAGVEDSGLFDAAQIFF
jgi:hypothetical protein